MKMGRASDFGELMGGLGRFGMSVAVSPVFFRFLRCFSGFSGDLPVPVGWGGCFRTFRFAGMLSLTVGCSTVVLWNNLFDFC